jgi:peptide/nickel transport system substrate-binding protein
MISPAAVAKYGNDFGSNPVGTGPFVLKQWTPGSSLVLEKNPSYWEKGKPYLDRIVFNDVSNSIIGMQRLITGELDYISALSPIDIRQIETRPNIRLDPGLAGRWYALQWQTDRPPFNNPKLRQAVAHAVDRARIVGIVMSGKGLVSEGPTPPGLWWHDPQLKSYPYDPARAKALLAEAGYPNGIEVGLSTPQITLLQQVNQLVQEQLKAVGITVRLEPMAQSDWYPRLAQGLINFSPIRWSQRPDPDGFLPLILRSNGSQNSTKYSNPEVDRLLDAARVSTDQAERRKIYSQAQEIIVRDLPYVPLFFSAEYAAMRGNVHNHAWIPDDIPRFREIWKTK